MSEALKPGTCVEVTDKGLIMLRRVMRSVTGNDAPPNHIGVISNDPWDDADTYLVEFPIGDDPMDEHSQSAAYPKHQVIEVSPDNPLYRYWEKK